MPILFRQNVLFGDMFSRLDNQNVLTNGFDYFLSVQAQVFLREWATAWGEMVVEDMSILFHTRQCIFGIWGGAYTVFLSLLRQPVFKMWPVVFLFLWCFQRRSSYLNMSIISNSLLRPPLQASEENWIRFYFIQPTSHISHLKEKGAASSGKMTFTALCLWCERSSCFTNAQPFLST